MKLKTECVFAVAHRLVGYDGACANLHGHNFRCIVEVSGTTLDNIGMLVDFKHIKRVIRELDHKTILKDCKENSELSHILRIHQGIDSVIMLDVNPTSENLALYIKNKLSSLYKYISFNVIVYESNDSYVKV